ncbi:hypothetical protein HK102_001654, partial [Quaeritorhiza haematococci]
MSLKSSFIKLNVKRNRVVSNYPPLNRVSRFSKFVARGSYSEFIPAIMASTNLTARAASDLASTNNARYNVVYQIFAGTIITLSVIEYILYIAAFLFCAYKVFRIHGWGGKLMVPVVVVLFLGLRALYLPMFIGNLPFPASFVEAVYANGSNSNPTSSSFSFFEVSKDLISLSLWITGGVYLLLLVMPMCVMVYVEIRGKLRDAQKLTFKDGAPTIVAIIPIYNELPQVLLAAIISVVESKYPKNRLHVFLAFDDMRETPLYLKTLKNLERSAGWSWSGINKSDPSLQSDPAQPKYPPILHTKFRDVKVTICRFPHGGKRLTQAQAFSYIEEMYGDDVKALHAQREGLGKYASGISFVDAAGNKDSEVASNRHASVISNMGLSKIGHDLFLLFIDSDVMLDKHAISFMVEDMIIKGQDSRSAVTGLITCASPTANFWWMLQDIEYVQGQMLDRCLESVCGAVTCLPGALTMVRYETLRKVAPLYFGQHKGRRSKSMGVFDYARYHLGEDRYLTHLFMELAPKAYQVGFVELAKCKTEAPDTFSTLLKQRRRWFLGALANEVAMLTSPQLWLRYPFLLLIRLLHDSLRSVSLLVYVIVVSMIVQTPPNEFWIPLIAFILPLVLNWLCMIYVGVFKLHRFKVIFYPLMHILHPFLQWTI